METLNQIISGIKSTSELRHLETEELQLVCSEVRERIIDVISKNPGHFSASLGAVELAVGIHSVFNTPEDKLVWDVGHQAYAHKILTGRNKEFENIRKYKGLSGFPKRSESIYDSFGVGHSSTSIGAILGMATAAKLNGDFKQQHIAVIGDGALTGGMAFEALNNAASLGVNALIIVNDNQMSIDPNVGALQEHLNTIEQYDQNFFEALGIDYYGKIDGNNLYELLPALKEQQQLSGVRVLHVKTVKGQGYFAAEQGNPTTWHAPGKFNPISGEQITEEEKYPKKYQHILGETLVKLARENKDIVAITPAMTSGSSLNDFQNEFPDRFFDVGIAEQHAVTFAAGLAANGKLPFCVIYSSFLQRGYDQLIHDVALQNLPVIFCIDRAGLVGADGSTHHGAFDISFLNGIPNLTIMSPLNEQEFANMLYSAQLNPTGPVVIRYPRGKGSLIQSVGSFENIETGKGRQLTSGKGLAILSFGPIGNQISNVLEVNKEVNCAHFDMRFVKPLDIDLLHDIFRNYAHIITIEDGVIQGGFGSSVLQFKNDHNYASSIKMLGIPDQFIEHGSREELYQSIGLDQNSLIKLIQSYST